jgi:outer membrane protein insertion porin family
VGAEVGSRRTFELGFGDPFVGDNNASYDLSLFNRIIYREPQSVAAVTGASTTFSYEERRTGFRANYTKPLDLERSKSLLFGFRSERAKLFQTDLTGTNPIPVNLPTAATGGVTGISFGFLRDARDLRLDPSRGGREQIIIEKGLSFLGGSSSFTKLDIDLRRYFPLMAGKKPEDQPKLVLAGRLVIGHAFGQLPAFEQYFIGGPDTVRGYEVDTQFGDNQYYSNFELRYRLQK